MDHLLRFLGRLLTSRFRSHIAAEVAKSTVERYMVKRPKPPPPTWRAFLANHVPCLVSIDFFTVPTVGHRVLHVLVIPAHAYTIKTNVEHETAIRGDARPEIKHHSLGSRTTAHRATDLETHLLHTGLPKRHLDSPTVACQPVVPAGTGPQPNLHARYTGSAPVAYYDNRPHGPAPLPPAHRPPALPRAAATTPAAQDRRPKDRQNTAADQQ